MQKSWVAEKGESYKYGIKDSIDFFNFLKEKLGAPTETDSAEDEPLQYRGTVVKVGFDRYGKYYGFISKMPTNIFFHQQDNPTLNFSALYAHDVLYYIKKDDNQNERAIEIKPI